MLAAATWTQAQRAPAPRAEPLRVGFLRGAPDGAPTLAELEALRRRIESDATLGAALADAGFSGAGLFPADGAEDLLRRLDAGEFDLAFVPARILARQRPGYRVALQARRDSDIFPPRGGLVLRGGAVIAREQRPVAEALAEGPVAVVATESLAGHIAPALLLRREHGIDLRRLDLVWFDSSEEVVKAVVSGLASAGVCESGALPAVLGAEWRAQGFVAVLAESEPVPTDPVVLRASLAPEVSPLGRLLRAAVVDHAREDGFGGVQYQEAADDAYARLPALLEEFAAPREDAAP
ncbi:MAG: PhnD/SsuA/transferrin family substrate-binding protein [Candidatus Sumerlaeia bacterium]|nr:PhnD/SsuA/transferrin family substrate-binding protein [Candidatus Sumerlaeia bacterium]